MRGIKYFDLLIEAEIGKNYKCKAVPERDSYGKDLYGNAMSMAVLQNRRIKNEWEKSRNAKLWIAQKNIVLFNPHWINFVNFLTKNEEEAKKAYNACIGNKSNDAYIAKYFSKLKNFSIFLLAVSAKKHGRKVEVKKIKRSNHDVMFSVSIEGSDGKFFHFHSKHFGFWRYKDFFRVPEEILYEDSKTNQKPQVKRFDNYEWLKELKRHYQYYK